MISIFCDFSQKTNCTIKYLQKLSVVWAEKHANLFATFLGENIFFNYNIDPWTPLRLSRHIYISPWLWVTSAELRPWGIDLSIAALEILHTFIWSGQKNIDGVYIHTKILYLGVGNLAVVAMRAGLIDPTLFSVYQTSFCCQFLHRPISNP
jgi:hypothetical protein